MGQSATELRHDIARTRDDLGETMDAIGDRMSPGRIIERRTNRMRNGFRSMRERVMGTASSATATVGDGVRDTAQRAVERVGDAADHAADTVRELPDTVRAQSQGNPLLAGGIAFGVGFLAAALPPSRTEQEKARALMDRMPPLTDEIAAVARDTAEHLREPALEAATNVKDAASDAARDVAETAKQDATDVAEQARQTSST